ncbi:TPA: hypothetical protein ACH3X2_004349 [Trebouxia sp. C0005]
MSSETSMSSQEEISTASERVEMDTSCVDKPSTSSGSEHSEQFAERSLYCLAFVDSKTGDAVRPATDEEAEEVARALSTAENRSKPQANATSAGATPTRQNSVSRPKPGGPCNNCGVVDSPQWRRGPAAAPVLCNACGTRFRRTSQLATGGLRALKRAAEAQKQQQAIKHPKVIALVSCTV